jgi:hypothetical protein
MIPQKKILSAIINHNRVDLIDEELPLFFYDDTNKLILKTVYEIKYVDRKTPTKNEIINKLGKSGLSIAKSEATRARLDDICEDMGIISENPKATLRGDFRSFYLNKGLNTLADKKKTNEQKEEQLHKISKVLSFAISFKESMLSTAIDNHITAITSGESIRFHENCIELTNWCLSDLFGRKIYPRPYCLFARPGDYKTSVLINMHVDFVKSGKMGMHITLEDTVDGYMIKHVACALDIGKQLITDNMATSDDLKNAKNHLKQDIIVYNDRKTVTELRQVLDSAMDRYDIKWVSIDYIQLIRPERGQSDLEMLKSSTSMFMDFCNTYCIPLIFLSQVNERDDEKIKTLRPGDTKGSGTIEADSRFMASINKTSLDTKSPDRLWHVCKTTDGGKHDKLIEFNPQSGKIVYVKTGGEKRYEETIVNPKAYNND